MLTIKSSVCCSVDDSDFGMITHQEELDKDYMFFLAHDQMLKQMFSLALARCLYSLNSPA